MYKLQNKIKNAPKAWPCGDLVFVEHGIIALTIHEIFSLVRDWFEYIM